jgi:endonuclease/exonuclease/phosphatase family metal-dependent hydrolase
MINTLRLPVILMLLAGILAIRSEAGDSNRKISGTFSVLTYNVAGLPEGLSGSHPLVYTSKISPGLNAFDMVLVQEDFAYHKNLKSKADHAYISEPGRAGALGDGLARFSNFPFGQVEHVPWKECYGTLRYNNDCLTRKGFSFATHEIAPEVFIHIYNLHMDAGESKGDMAAREAEMDQLIKWMTEKSNGKAVIIGGDWNLNAKRERDMELLDRILTEENLRDSCRSLQCGEERIDRILFRGNDIISLKPVAYKVETERFANKRGKQFSDHEAVSIVIEWAQVKNGARH